MEERIVISQEEMLLSVEEALNAMRAFRYDSRYQGLGEGFLERAASWEKTICERRKDPLTVVVIGDFKRGKSTFLNALLGEVVVPSNVTPETVTLNRVSYGEPKNEAVLSGHRRMRLSDEELKRNHLEKVLREIKEPVRRLELTRPCEILKQISVIDTPGLGDAMEDFSEMVGDAILQADVVVYVYNVKYPLSQSEQLFLKGAVLPQKYTKLFLVGNYADTLEDEESFHRVEAILRERIDGLLPEAEVLMVSALDELCRRTGGKRPCPELCGLLEEQFDRFRGQLERFMEEKRETVVIDRIQRLTGAMIQQLGTELDAMERGLEMDREAAEQEALRLRQDREQEMERQGAVLAELERAAAEMKAEANGWMQGFLARIERETEYLGASSSEDIRKYYSCYCTDMLQTALTACVEHHREEMFDRLEKISEESVAKLARGLTWRENYYFRMNLDNRIWTRGDTLGLAVSMIPGNGLLGTVLNLSANAVAGAMRQKETAERTEELVDQIRAGFTGLAVSMRQTTDSLYAELSGKAKQVVMETFEEETQRLEQLMRETLHTASFEEGQKDAVRQVVLDARALLEHCGEALML